MEDVIEIYALPLDETNPVVCFDESPFQLLREVREPMPGAPGRPRREDSEHERCGVAEVMMICQPAAGLLKCMVMEHRKKTDFRLCARSLTGCFPKPRRSRRSDTHTKGALYATFPRRGPSIGHQSRDQAHAQAWVVAEHRRAGVCRFGPDGLQETDPDKEQLQRELDAICAHKNALAKPVQWQFNLPKARSKMA
jgi:hypothetical protein